VKLFVNKTTMDFSEAEEDTATQEIVITPEQLKSDTPPLQLRFVKFQNVTSLTVSCWSHLFFIYGNLLPL
jgi:hypothetical protein